MGAAFPAAASAQGWACQEHNLWPTTPAKAAQPREAPCPSLSPRQLQLLGALLSGSLPSKPADRIAALCFQISAGCHCLWDSVQALQPGTHDTSPLVSAPATSSSCPALPSHWIWHCSQSMPGLSTTLLPAEMAPFPWNTLRSLPPFTLCVRECIVESKAPRSLGVSIHFSEPQFAEL